MKKTVVLTGVLFLSILAFGQQADKFAMLGKAGYAAGAPIDAFYGGLSFEYMFWKRLGVVAGINRITGNTFPNKNGSIQTGYWEKNNKDPYEGNSGDLFYYTHDKIFPDSYLGDLSYYSYSDFSVVVGVMVHALSNENNIIAVSLGANYSWQLYENYYLSEVGPDDGTTKAVYQRYTGIGFTGDVTYRRRVYKSFWAGVYAQLSPFSAEYSNHNSSVGAELSVRF